MGIQSTEAAKIGFYSPSAKNNRYAYAQTRRRAPEGGEEGREGREGGKARGGERRGKERGGKQDAWSGLEIGATANRVSSH